ncbi:MAG: endolytic transglycosylase MltG [Anaerolineae bacterium]|nr:endolytic transglycosylase MltG [Anaerolineae bacterium]
MKRWIILIISLCATVVLLGCEVDALFLGAYIESQSDALKKPAGADDAPVSFTVESGETVTQIAGSLKALGLIKDTELFRRYLQYKGLDAGIQAGTYTLRQTMTIPEIALTLQHAETNEQQVTIPEGKRAEEVAAIVAEQTDISAEEFLQIAQVGWRGTDLLQKYPLLAQIPLTATLEGYLFPDTYRLPDQATAYDLIDRMVANFIAQVTPEVQQGITAQGLTLHEGITLASIVEREAVIATERPLIAGVYYNRLRDGWPLSADPTVQYALGYRPDEESWWKGQLFFSDLEVVSPYNTYRNQGLPPAPIASPGSGAIKAVATPEETDYYFFMVDCTLNNGTHVFAHNEAEHLENYTRCGGVLPSQD